MAIGFIGLGGMGQAIALNLLRAGHGMTVWNRSPDPTKPLAAEGAKVAAKAGEVRKGRNRVLDAGGRPRGTRGNPGRGRAGHDAARRRPGQSFSHATFHGIWAVALCLQASTSFAEPAPAQVRPFIRSVILVDVLPNRIQEALPLLRRYAADTRKQPGCVAFELVEELPSMTNHFAMLGTWLSDDDRDLRGNQRRPDLPERAPALHGKPSGRAKLWGRRAMTRSNNPPRPPGSPRFIIMVDGHYDVIITGSGPGGGSMAWRLAQLRTICDRLDRPHVVRRQDLPDRWHDPPS